MATTIIGAHKATLREERLTNPERFTFQRSAYLPQHDLDSYTSKRRIGGSQLGGARSEIEIQASVNPADIKQVQVKNTNK